MYIRLYPLLSYVNKVVLNVGTHSSKMNHIMLLSNVSIHSSTPKILVRERK